jgi:hypothetical protein
MKEMKTFFVTLILLVSVSLTSCIDGGDDSSSWDFFKYGTVVQSAFGGVAVYTDDGLTLTLSNPSVIKYTDGTYPTRVAGYYKLATGETLQTGKTNYTVSFVTGNLIVTKNFNQKPDTIKKSYSITSIDGYYIANSYATVFLSFPYKTASNVSFDMYTQRVGNDTLYVALNYTNGGSDDNSGNLISQIPYSFKLPSNIEIQPKNDSIWVKVSAKGINGTLVGKARCKYMY